METTYATVTNAPQNTNEIRAAKARSWLLTILILVPAVIMAGKHPLFMTSGAFRSWFTLGELPRHVQPHVEYMLFVPLSAIVVAFFRLTLGMRCSACFGRS